MLSALLKGINLVLTISKNNYDNPKLEISSTADTPGTKLESILQGRSDQIMWQ